MRTLSADMRGSGRLPSPAHFGVMVTLAYQSCNLSELADVQDVSPPTMSSTINTLEERGWVKRTRSIVDRRVVNIELTEAGLDRLLKIRRHAELRLLELLATIDDEERDALAQGLKVMSRMFEVIEGPASIETPVD
jgi:DNA-binding MarR family transcriptional regulator